MYRREEYYSSRKDMFAERLRILKCRNRWFLSGEIVTFLFFIAFLAIGTVDGVMPWMMMSVLSLVAYIAVRKFDADNSGRIEHVESLLAVNERELNYLHGDFSCFEDGSCYVDAQHPFTFDLDVFGQDSLYNRICRTVTTDGSKCLAGRMSGLGCYDGNYSALEIDARRKAIDELAALTEWREEFMVSGVKEKIDTHRIVVALKSVRGIDFSDIPLSVTALVFAFVVLTVFFVLIVLSVFDYLPSVVPVVWGILQFFIILMLFSGTLRTISASLNKLHEHMRACKRIVMLVDALRTGRCVAKDVPPVVVRSEELSELLDSLEGAPGSFHDMERILADIDRRANVLGLIFFDMFMLSDFFLVRRFLKWRCMYEDRIALWVDSIGRIDALVSMATLRYNEPHAVAAKIVDSVQLVYEAKSLYHPFVGKNAVRNDFILTDNNYYIITGANMAGKSTFLRTIGVNYILAMNGMPVFAESMKVSVFSLFTSMRTTDDLTHGISYFNAELLRLKQLIAYCASKNSTLIILDEILKGTNSADKLGGSRLFLEYMSKQNVTGIIATHDLELSRMADEYPSCFHNYCFEIELGTSVTYSYKITSGVARNQNATFLLKNILEECDRKHAMYEKTSG